MATPITSRHPRRAAQLAAESLDAAASEIAHHLTRAGPAAEPRRLLRFLSLAGRQAMRTAGFEDALRHFEQALGLIEVAEPVCVSCWLDWSDQPNYRSAGPDIVSIFG